MKLSLYGAMAVAMIFVSSATNAIALKEDDQQLTNLIQTEVDTEHDFLDDLMNCGGRKAFQRPKRVIQAEINKWETLQRKKQELRRITEQNKAL